jgi:predicted phosphodiesterase
MPARALTLEEIARRREAVARHAGNLTAAARELGIARPTLAHSLRDSPAARDEATDETSLSRRVEELTEQLEVARKARGLELPAKSRRKTPRTYCRLILADAHGSHASPDALAAVLADLDRLDVREVVLLGDMLECGGFLAQHHTLGYVAQIDETAYEDDIAATNDLLDRIQTACPHARIHYLEGNHEHRIERWCVDQGLTSRNAEYLLRAIGPERVLRLSDRGVSYYRQGERHGVDVPGVIRLGKTYFTHSGLTRKHAAAGMVERFAGCVWYGHTHRADSHTTRLVSTGLIAAWCPGCLSALQPRWRHSDPTGWTHGYGLQIVDRDSADFLSVHVPIQGANSYLVGLARALAG